MDDFKSDTAKLIQSFMIGVLIIVCVLVVCASIFGIPYMVQKGNNDKVREMTSLCISKGYDGWEDFAYDSDDKPRGCFKNED